MESNVFRNLPKDTRDMLEVRNVFAGTEWGREGVARRLAAMTLDSAGTVSQTVKKRLFAFGENFFLVGPDRGQPFGIQRNAGTAAVFMPHGIAR